MNAPTETPVFDQNLIRLGHDYLEGKAPAVRLLLALAAHDHLDFPGEECWSNKLAIVVAMTAGLVGPFPRQDEILSLIGQYVEKYPNMQPLDLYKNLSLDL